MVNDEQFIVYPNPSSGSVTIHTPIAGVYTLVNELGQTVTTIHLNESNNNTLNIDNLSSGIYMIIGLNNQQTTKQRIIIQK